MRRKDFAKQVKRSCLSTATLAEGRADADAKREQRMTRKEEGRREKRGLRVLA